MLGISARALFIFMAAASLALVGGALFMQEAFGLAPCPLCILQRIAFLLLALLSMIGVVVANRPLARWFSVGSLLAAIAGAGVAAWHVRLQSQPESLSCGPGLATMLENFPLTHVLPKVFAGSGDCADPGAAVFGVSLAAWALVAFLGLALTAIAALARR
jgi:disulfide bond formation protein DsbB